MSAIESVAEPAYTLLPASSVADHPWWLQTDRDGRGPACPALINIDGHLVATDLSARPDRGDWVVLAVERRFVAAVGAGPVQHLGREILIGRYQGEDMTREGRGSIRCSHVHRPGDNQPMRDARGLFLGRIMPAPISPLTA